jgi:HK97 family phage prohead protease
LTKHVFLIDAKAGQQVGAFSGLASVYGNEDLQGDVVAAGAFTKSIAARGALVPVLWQHDSADPVGMGAVSDTPQGLRIDGQLDVATPQGARAYSAIKKGYVRGLSIGYDVVKQKFEKGARWLTELNLYEVSLATFPANESALVAEVKSMTAPAVRRDDLVLAFRRGMALETMKQSVAAKRRRERQEIADAVEAADRRLRRLEHNVNLAALEGGL